MASVLVLCSFFLAGASRDSSLTIFGYGNVGKAVAREVRSDFDWIRGTSREVSSDNGEVIPFNDGLTCLARSSHILITIPANGSMDPVMTHMASVVARETWIGLVSTTGVYGNHNGAWVTEDSSLLSPESSPSHRYIEYEKRWQECANQNGWKLSVFRCAGLYGPTRSALHTVLKKGFSAMSSRDGITNRIHEHDVARAIASAMQQSTTGVFNLADDLPEKRSVVAAYAAELLESIGRAPRRNEAESESTTRSKRRGSEIKLVSNQRMKEELIDELLYPTYREGLQAIIQEMIPQPSEEVE